MAVSDSEREEEIFLFVGLLRRPPVSQAKLGSASKGRLSRDWDPYDSKVSLMNASLYKEGANVMFIFVIVLAVMLVSAFFLQQC